MRSAGYRTRDERLCFFRVRFSALRDFLRKPYSCDYSAKPSVCLNQRAGKARMWWRNTVSFGRNGLIQWRNGLIGRRSRSSGLRIVQIAGRNGSTVGRSLPMGWRRSPMVRRKSVIGGRNGLNRSRNVPFGRRRNPIRLSGRSNPPSEEGRTRPPVHGGRALAGEGRALRALEINLRDVF